MDRTGHAGHGRLVGFANDISRTFGLAHLDGPFHDGAEQRDLINLLRRVAEHVFRHRSARDHDYGTLSHHGVGHTGDQVRGARPVRSHAYSWFAGYSGEAVSHEGGGLLVTNRYEAQLFSAIHPV